MGQGLRLITPIAGELPVDDEDSQTNETALKEGLRLYSVYPSGPTKFYVVARMAGCWNIQAWRPLQGGSPTAYGRIR